MSSSTKGYFDFVRSNGQRRQPSPQHGQVLPSNVSETVIKQCDALITATSVNEALEASRAMKERMSVAQGDYGIKIFFKLSTVLNVKILAKWDRVNSILKTLLAKANQKEYVQGRLRVSGRKVLVIGGGLAGLRASIELLLLGAQVICVEKRDDFSRNNVIHLWPNVINDMKSFEAKRYYNKFCVGDIDHISIRQLQLLLLKIALVYGLRFVTGVTFDDLCCRLTQPKKYDCDRVTCDCCCHQHGFGEGAHAHFHSEGASAEVTAGLNSESFDVIIGCDGRRQTFSKYFPRNSRRGKLAIGLTANYVNKGTDWERYHCKEISGRSRPYHRDWFKDLETETDIELENLVYYRDLTHYFVMTATKQSLLKRGVLKADYPDSHQLLDTNNIDIHRLMRYSKDAAEWSSKLRDLEFALTSNEKPDVALFDFTAMYSAVNASCAKKIYQQCCSSECQDKTKYVPIMLCGDSLLEPFWPTGSGAGRGFLSAIDAAWTVCQWFTNVQNESNDIDGMLDVISKREYIYRLLAQTAPVNTTDKNFTLCPTTRYKNVSFERNKQALHEIKSKVRHLIIDKEEVNKKKYTNSYEAKRSRRATVDINVEEVAKARAINSRNSFNAFDFNDDYGYRGRRVANGQRPISDFVNNSTGVPLNAVPSSFASSNARSSTTTLANSNCDSLEVYEYKPRNVLDSEAYEPRNSFLDQDFEYRPRNRLVDNVEEEPRQSSIGKVNGLHSSDYRSSNGFYQQNSLSQSTTKLDEYLNPRSDLADYNRLFNVDNSSVESSNASSDYKEKKEPPTYNEQRSRRSFLEERRNFLLRKSNDPAFNRRDEDEAFQREKPKVSSDILEKAMHLEHKLDEFKKPFEPTLTKVGKIEEEDWNVKVWNSADVFAPKIKDKLNIVYDNSKDLLQSRIQQLSNNMNPTVVNLTPKNRVTNDYVNMLQSEISKKLSGAPKSGKATTTSINSTNTGDVSSLNSASNSALPVDSSLDLLRLKALISTSKPATATTSSMKSFDLLRPLGVCKRCDRSVAAVDKATVKGECFHRTCLRCKTCSVALRIDEFENDDFLCKLCTSRRDFSSMADARSSFMTGSVNLSRIEAKKNFLINVDQIDFRERAEFDINDVTDLAAEVKKDGVADLAAEVKKDAVDDLAAGVKKDGSAGKEIAKSLEDSPEMDAAKTQTMKVDKAEVAKEDDEDVEISDPSSSCGGDSSSSANSTSSTGSGPNSVDTNYTDDERSETSDYEPSVRKGSIDSTRAANKRAFDSVVNKINDHLMTSSMFAQLDLPTIDGEEEEDEIEHSRDSPPSPAPLSSALLLNDNHRLACLEDSDVAYQSLPGTNGQASPLLFVSLETFPGDGSGNSKDLLVDSFGVELRKKMSENQQLAGRLTHSYIDPKTLEIDEMKADSAKAPLPAFKYGGQFTEKLFRTNSQPTLFEQMSKLDEKLKSRRYPAISREELSLKRENAKTRPSN